MEKRNPENLIFEKKLTFSELFKVSFQLILFFKKEILICFFSFFIPVLVFQSLVFRNELHLSVIQLTQEIHGTFILFLLTDSFFQEFFFAAIILFAVSFFEKKILFPNLFFRVLFSKILLFIITYSLSLGFIAAGIFAFIIPGLLVAFFLSFAFFLVFSEKVFGMEALTESFRTIKTFWLRVFLFFVVLNALKFFLASGVSYLFLKVKIPWPELEFLLSNLITYLLILFPSLIYAILFFNLRHQMKPKDKDQLPVSE